MEKKDCPEHLHGLHEIIEKYRWSSNAPDEKEYAEIAFALLKVADGDKAALNKVTEYIQSQHKRQEAMQRNFSGLLRDADSFLSWAAVWTIRGKSA